MSRLKSESDFLVTRQEAQQLLQATADVRLPPEIEGPYPNDKMK